MRIYDDQDSIVTDALEGHLSGGHGEDPELLDGFPHIKVVVRGGPEEDRVAVISGGGSGHEPSHVGWVADGLLVVKNYTGDRRQRRVDRRRRPVAEGCGCAGVGRSKVADRDDVVRRVAAGIGHNQASATANGRPKPRRGLD